LLFIWKDHILFGAAESEKARHTLIAYLGFTKNPECDKGGLLALLVLVTGK